MSLRQQLIDLHPNWTHTFYDDAACRELIRRELPNLLPLYDAYPTAIQRTDLFRIAAVYVSGGFYVDMDIDCRRPLDPLCGAACILGEERTLTEAHARSLGHEHPLRVANYMFGSIPRHPFWLDVLDAMVQQSQRPILCENDILESTGPGLLTNVYHVVEGRHRDIVLVTNDELACPTCRAISCHFGRYARHLHLGSWRSLLNSTPSP